MGYSRKRRKENEMKLKRFQPKDTHKSAFQPLMSLEDAYTVIYDKLPRKCFPVYNFKSQRIEIAICGLNSVLYRYLSIQDDIIHHKYDVIASDDGVSFTATPYRHNLVLSSEIKIPNQEEIETFAYNYLVETYEGI